MPARETTPEPFVLLGRVAKTHGLKGEVSVIPAADLPFVLPLGLEVWFVPPPLRVRAGRVENVRRGPKGPLVKVSGIDDLSTAQGLVGSQLMSKAADLPAEWTEEPAPDGQDPVGLIVTDVVRGVLGEVTELIATGANDVWVVDGPLGEVLLPVIGDVVLQVDWNAKTASVRALAGLLPEDEEA